MARSSSAVIGGGAPRGVAAAVWCAPPPAPLRRGHGRVDRPAQPAVRRHELLAASLDDVVPELLPVGAQLVTAQWRQFTHGSFITGSGASDQDRILYACYGK